MQEIMFIECGIAISQNITNSVGASLQANLFPMGRTFLYEGFKHLMAPLIYTLSHLAAHMQTAAASGIKSTKLHVNRQIA